MEYKSLMSQKVGVLDGHQSKVFKLQVWWNADKDTDFGCLLFNV